MDRLVQIYANTSVWDFSNLKIRRVNGTRAIVGYLMFNEPMGNDVMVESALYVKQGGEYRTMPYRFPRQGYCDFAAGDIYMYPDMTKNSDLPADVRANCSLKPGKYNFHNVILKLEKMPKAVAKSGDYICESKFYLDDVLMLHCQSYLKVINVI
jgi:hypothetical protein